MSRRLGFLVLRIVLLTCAPNRLVSEKTTIPIPKVIAYAIGEASKIVPNFAIIEYLEGQKLNAVELRNLESAKKARFNASMADFFVQLRRLEFDAIGRVVQRNGDFVVDRPPATIDINSQALEGLQPEKVVERYAKGGPLRSASDYLHMLLDLADNAYTKSRCSVDSDNQKYAREQLYYLSGFRHFAEEWQAKEDDDQGPFVLVHGDLETFNLLIGDEGEIVGFLDWEWSRVLPRRYLTPPTFPSFNLEAQAAYYGFYWLYKDGLRPLFDAVRARELELYGNTVLADEWGVGKEDGGFMVAKSLEAWSLMGFFSENFIDIKVHKGEGLDERVESFLQQDPSRRDLIERKMQDDEAYSAELKRLIESEKSASQVVRERCHRAFSNCKLVLGDNLWNKDGPTRSWPGMAIICGAGLACIISASLRYAKWSRRP